MSTPHPFLLLFLLVWFGSYKSLLHGFGLESLLLFVLFLNFLTGFSAFFFFSNHMNYGNTKEWATFHLSHVSRNVGTRPRATRYQPGGSIARSPPALWTFGCTFGWMQALFTLLKKAPWGKLPLAWRLPHFLLGRMWIWVITTSASEQYWEPCLLCRRRGKWSENFFSGKCGLFEYSHTFPSSLANSCLGLVLALGCRLKGILAPKVQDVCVINHWVWECSTRGQLGFA